MSTETIDTRQKILDAAMERIHHYGYSKTTMSEIAKDCDMSAGNIYRFFASKIDIAEAMARNSNAKMFQSHAAIVREKTPAATRLRKLFSNALTDTYELIADDAKILEVAEVLKRERPSWYNEQLAQERVYLVQLLKDGIEAGEFRNMEHPEEITEFIQASLMKFRYPQLFSQLNIDKLTCELNGVLDLLLAGLAK
jgi:AcrR family transcriptional regulator